MSTHPLSTIPLSSWGDWPEVEQPATAQFELIAEMDVGVVNPIVDMLANGSAKLDYAATLRPRPATDRFAQ